MTRINSNLDPSILLDQHLMAEYRELPMVFASLKRSMASRSVDDILKTIPAQFTLGTGHVSFFYDKLTFLDARYSRLIGQLKCRGYSLDENRHQYTPSDYPSVFQNDWVSTQRDDKIVASRIREKYNMKPEWYKYFGEKIEPVVFDCLYRCYN